MYYLHDWEVLPDRTVALHFDGVSFRHSILEHTPADDCKSVYVNEDDSISLLTHLGNNAFKYVLKGTPDFYKIGDNDWEWVGDRTGEKFKGR